MVRNDVVVVGSGLAGMAAVFRLADAGRRVLVLEAAPVLGGRTASWSDGGMPVESGLHKFLGIYRALPRLLRDAGVDPHSILAWVDEMAVHVPPLVLPGRALLDANDPDTADPILDRTVAVAEGSEIHARFGTAPYHRPLAALPGHPWFAPMLSLETLSAVTVQMELDRPALPSDRTNFSPTAVCCFAEQSRTTFTHAPGRLSAILYPPAEFLHMEPGAVLERTIADAARIGIDLRGWVKDYRVVRHPHDFYALRPGSEAMRPTQRTPVPGLALAGDYTKQPFVASMEGAVLSGERAAEAVRSARPESVSGVAGATVP